MHGSHAIPALRFDPAVDRRAEVRSGPSDPPPRQFQISFWPNGVATWAVFGKPVSAWTPREAIEKCRPRAFGRYRVAALGRGEPAAVFQVSRTPQGCGISEIGSAALAGQRS
jgi:hypothetical protein